MSKKPNIRWSKNDSKKITNDVRNFNAKITRTLKAHPEWADYMPSRKSTKEIKNNVTTRADLKRELHSLERFMKKGNESPLTSATGIKTTKWEKREVGLKVAQINRNRTNDRKKADVSTYKGTMGTIASNNLKPKKYDIDKIKVNEWGKFISTVDKQVMSNYKGDKIEKYKANYLRAIRENLGDGKDANKLYDYVSNLDAVFMYDKYYDDPILEIQFISNPLPIYMIIESTLEHWKNAMGETTDKEYEEDSADEGEGDENEE